MVQHYARGLCPDLTCTFLMPNYILVGALLVLTFNYLEFSPANCYFHWTGSWRWFVRKYCTAFISISHLTLLFSKYFDTNRRLDLEDEVGLSLARARHGKCYMEISTT